MELSEIKARIEQLAPGTTAEVIDLTGNQKEFLATVQSPIFINRSELEQQRMIFELFRVEVDSEVIHSMTLKTTSEPNISSS